jgi:hypothetical protein
MGYLKLSLKKREHHLKIFSGEILSSETPFTSAAGGNLYALI